MNTGKNWQEMIYNMFKGMPNINNLTGMNSDMTGMMNMFNSWKESLNSWNEGYGWSFCFFVYKDAQRCTPKRIQYHLTRLVGYS
jgi:hypothetical protein